MKYSASKTRGPRLTSKKWRKSRTWRDWQKKQSSKIKLKSRTRKKTHFPWPQALWSAARLTRLHILPSLSLEATQVPESQKPTSIRQSRKPSPLHWSVLSTRCRVTRSHKSRWRRNAVTKTKCLIINSYSQHRDNRKKQSSIRLFNKHKRWFCKNEEN